MHRFLAEQLKHVFTFGFLKIRKSYSKTAYKISNRILELTSDSTNARHLRFPIYKNKNGTVITASQHNYGFVPTTQSQIQV